MAGRFRNFLGKIRRYPKYMRFGDALYFIVFECINRQKLRRIRLNDQEIFVRTATTDALVAASCLSDGEFSNIEISHPSVIIDAGAYIGASTIYFAKKYPDARIFAIEPEEENYNLLLKNTETFKNVVPIKAALSSRKESREILHRDSGAWGYTILVAPDRTKSMGQTIDCVTLDSILQEHDIESIDILKMDIEGSEIDVLGHAENWIDKVKIITAELHDKMHMGCDRAFYLATKEFARFEKNGEKVTAYRH